jgi:hypothetical protein
VLATTALSSSSAPSHAVRQLTRGISPHVYGGASLTVQQSSYKHGAATSVGFLFSSDPTLDATAKFTIFSPAGYTTTLTQTPGTVIGKAFAYVRAFALGGADLTLTGNVVVGDPTNPALVTAYAQCKSASDPSTPQAIWVLNRQLNGQALQVPAFVNTAGPYLTQEICLPPPETAPFQAQLWLADYTIKGIFRNAAATKPYDWVADFTPYVGTTPNPAGTVEYRTYVGLDSSLTFKKAKSRKASLVAFTGKLKVRGLSTRGIKLDLFYSTMSHPAPNLLNPSKAGILGKSRFGRSGAVTKTGAYSLSRPKPKKKRFFQAIFWGYERSPGCQGPSPSGLPIPCIHEEIAPIPSAQIAVAPAKRHK